MDSVTREKNRLQFMKKILIFIIGLIFCSFISFGQQNVSKNKKNRKNRESTTVLSDREQLALSSKFINAVKERLIGNYENAEIILREIINDNPSHDAAHFEYAQVLMAQHKTLEAQLELKKAIELNDTNFWYKIMLGDIYNMTQNYIEAENLWKSITEQYPDNVEYLYNYALTLVYQNKFKEAIKIYDKMELQTGVNEEIISVKHNIWIHLKDIDKAGKELNKLVEAYPYEIKYYLQIADFYNVNGMSKKAIPYIEKAQKIDPNNVDINIILYNYYVSEKKSKEAFETLQKVFAATSLPIDEKIKIIMRYFPLISNNQQYNKEAFILLDLLIKAHPDSPMAWSVYGDFLSKDNQFGKAANAYEKVLQYDKSKYLVWEQYLSLLVELKHWEKALEESNKAKELFPTQALPYFICGLVSYQNKDWNKAIDNLEEGSKYISDNKGLLLQTYFYLAESYNNTQDFKKSDEYFEKILVKDPNNILVLNNYGYFLSLRNERLDYALVLAEKANKLAPGNAVYEDTYGWIFFKKGNLEQAEVWVKKALEHEGENDADILEHYGDILYQKGEKNKAFEYWNKAKEKGNNNPLLLKKIEEIHP